MKTLTICIVISVILLLLIYIFSRKPNIITIPKIIHQLAPADKSKWHEVWYECQNSWKNMYPNYKYILWTDEMMDDFMKKEFPKYYDMYKNYKAHINRVDAVRYFILYKYGGIYADMDMQVLNDFMPYIPQNKVSMVESPYKYNENCQNSLMISPAKHPFWKHVFDELVSSKDHTKILDIAGPRMIDRAMKGWNINVLSHHMYNPNKFVKMDDKSIKRLFTRHYGTSVYIPKSTNTN